MAKGEIGGKRGVVPSEFSDKDAGVKHKLEHETAGVKREFKGSRTQRYTFTDKQHGPHTFTTVSYEDALRQAKALGYTSDDYVGVKDKKKRNKRGK